MYIQKRYQQKTIPTDTSPIVATTQSVRNQFNREDARPVSMPLQSDSFDLISTRTLSPYTQVQCVLGTPFPRQNEHLCLANCRYPPWGSRKTRVRTKKDWQVGRGGKRNELFFVAQTTVALAVASGPRSGTDCWRTYNWLVENQLFRYTPGICEEIFFLWVWDVWLHFDLWFWWASLN